MVLFIPGVRPGENTAKAIDRILARLTFVGAIYVTLVCLLPEFLILKYNVLFYFWWNLVVDFGCCDNGLYGAGSDVHDESAI